MNYRTLGRTGLRVSALALGTVELGVDYGIAAPGQFGRPAETDAIRLVHAALDAGLNLIDTARDYGASETVLGHALRDRRGQVVLATKVNPLNADGSTPRGTALRDRMLDTLETSLCALQTDYVDIWQIHNVTDGLLAQADVLAETFAAARRNGAIRWRGGSFYGTERPRRGIQSGLFDVIQVTYSVFDQRVADHVLPAATQHNVGVLARSLLLKGVLTDRADHLPTHLDTLRRHSQHYRRILTDWQAATGQHLTPAQAAIAFGLAQPHIDTALIGVRSVAELAENLRAAALTLPPDLLAQLHALRLDDETLLDPSTWGIP